MASELYCGWEGVSNGKDKFICTKQIFESLESSSRLTMTKSPKMMTKMMRNSQTEAPVSALEKKRAKVGAIIMAFEERSRSVSLLATPVRNHPKPAPRPSSLLINNNKNRSTYLTNYMSALSTTATSKSDTNNSVSSSDDVINGFYSVHEATPTPVQVVSSPSLEVVVGHLDSKSCNVRKLSQSFEELATTGRENQLKSSTSVPAHLGEDLMPDCDSDDSCHDHLDASYVINAVDHDGDVRETHSVDDVTAVEEECYQSVDDVIAVEEQNTHSVDDVTAVEEDDVTAVEEQIMQSVDDVKIVQEDYTQAVDDVINDANSDEDDATVDNRLFYYEIPGLPQEVLEEVPIDEIARPRKVGFSCDPIQVFVTYSKDEYDRFNDEADPIIATAEYELEKRLERLIIFDVEIEKGSQPLGLSIVGIGVGADTGVEKLGMFVKTVVPGGSIHADDRIKVNDQIIEVDGHSLVGVSQHYASDVLSNTTGVIRFKVGREKDPHNSEIARLVQISIEREKRNQQEDFSEEEDEEEVEDLNQAMIDEQSEDEDPPQRSNLHQHFTFEQQTTPIEDVTAADDDSRQLAELKNEVVTTKAQLDETKAHACLLEKKYNKAKKLIKEFQTREEEFLRRESTLKDHINKLQRDKDQVESKISTLEVQINQIALAANLPMKGLESNKTHSSSDSERKPPRLQNDSTGVALTSDESDKVVGSVYDNLTEDIIGELDNVLAINRPNLFVTSFDAKKQLRKEEEAVTSHTNKYLVIL